MPRMQSGRVFERANDWAVRWTELDGSRPIQGGFRNKTAAQTWFNENVRERITRRDPSAEMTFDHFCDVFLERHGATVSPRTRETLEERLKPTRKHFGAWKLRELEDAAGDVAAWRATLPESSHYRIMSAFRQCLGAAVRWRHMNRNPAVDAGRNPQPRVPEIFPLSRAEVDAVAAELGRVYGPLVVVAAETGLRTNEWAAIERGDIDRTDIPAAQVQRRVSRGRPTPYPKTARSRRRVPLSERALTAIDRLPARLDTRLLFPAPDGGWIDLPNWRTRDWYPALEAAGLERCGPYSLRDTFATETLASGVSIFELSRRMGASVKTIDDRYGHLAGDSDAAFLERVNARQ